MQGAGALMSEEAEADTFGAIAKRAALWLLVLAPFFYASYGAANWLASLRDDVPNVMYDWEHAIPFVPWTIIPYWSINAFYALSLFINDTKRGVDRLAGRYLTAQVIAISCFIAFPLIAVFVRPETFGLPGLLFDILGGFDKPFNQAPSLHIALLVIIWDHLRARLGGLWLTAWHLWCALIGISVLTTWQHHFLDIPTGALLGLFALWLFPRTGRLPFEGFSLTADGKARRIGSFYLIGAVVCLVAAWSGAYQSTLWLVLLWPALALAIVAFGYFGAGPAVFQKASDGTVTLASRVLLLPYRIGASVNIWAWTRNLPAAVEVATSGGQKRRSAAVFLGRFPSPEEANAYDAVIDMTAEFVRPRSVTMTWHSVPVIDLLHATETDRLRAAALIEGCKEGAVLVCCALGFQRSASIVAEWLLHSGRVASHAEAEALLRTCGRPVHLSSPVQSGEAT